MEPKSEPKLDLCEIQTTYFHPWVDKVAQLVPKELHRVPKGYQNGAKMLSQVFEMWAQNAAPGV